MSDEKIKVQIDVDLEDLIPNFLENRKVDVEKLKEAMSTNDFDVLRSIGHSVKGVGGGYGFDLMSEYGAAIETAAKDNNMDIIKEKIEQLDDYINRIDIEFI